MSSADPRLRDALGRARRRVRRARAAGQALFSLFAGGSNLAIAASTLVVAALFLPVARAYSASSTAASTAAATTPSARSRASARAFASRSTSTLERDLHAVVTETMQPAHASVWLRARRSRERDRTWLAGGRGASSLSCSALAMRSGVGGRAPRLAVADLHRSARSLAFGTVGALVACASSRRTRRLALPRVQVLSADGPGRTYAERRSFVEPGSLPRSSRLGSALALVPPVLIGFVACFCPRRARRRAAWRPVAGHSPSSACLACDQRLSRRSSRRRRLPGRRQPARHRRASACSRVRTAPRCLCAVVLCSRPPRGRPVPPLARRRAGAAQVVGLCGR